MIFAGIDVGSRSSKIILWDHSRQTILARGCVDQGVAQRRLAAELLDRLLAQQVLSRHDLRGIVATGYGRNLIDFADTTITEITCHAHGVLHGQPSARTIVEIGGQDSKSIRLDPRGQVRDFAMNDRCAAGTGRFLEMVATRLGVPLEDLGNLARQSQAKVTISSMCVVFAESEIIGLLASGRHPGDLVAAVQSSIAARVAAMSGRNLDSPVLFTGGVALVPGMAEALETTLARPVRVATEPLFTGALGAALLAARQNS